MVDEDQDTDWATFLVIQVGSGAILGGIVEAASNRFGGFSILAVFLAGWLAQVGFRKIIDANQ